MRRVLRWITAGESHGPALVAVLEGMVAGVEITTKELTAELARRRLGYGRGARMEFEADEIEVIGGVRHGLTQGGPVAVRIGNTEWPKWETVMAADPVDPELIANRARNAPLTRPRPGHADLAGMTKYGFDDARPVLERASARETASRVALGTVAKAFLRQALGVEVVSHVVAIGAVDAPDDDPVPGPGDLERIDASPVRAFSEATAAAMMAEIDAAQDDGDTLGGVDRGDRLRPAGRARLVRAGRPPARRPAGRGADGHPGDEGRRDRRRVPHRAPAGQRGARRDAPRAHRGVTRLSNRAGGIEGGMTNGEPVRVRVAMKPISTVPRALRTVDVATGEAATAIHQRSDVCAVPRGRRRGRGRWWRWCWPTRRWRSSAATRWRRRAATSAATSRLTGGTGARVAAPRYRSVGVPGSSTLDRRESRRRSGAASPLWSWSGRPVPARRPSAGCWPAGSGWRSPTSTR